MFDLYDGRSHFWQWDANQKLVTTTLPLGTEVHFYHDKAEKLAFTMLVEQERGARVCKVPNALMEHAGTIKVYVYTTDATGARTTHRKTFTIKPRQKPPGYVYTETETYTLKTAMQKAVNEIKVGPAGKDGRDGVDGRDGDTGVPGERGNSIYYYAGPLSLMPRTRASEPSGDSGTENRVDNIQNLGADTLMVDDLILDNTGTLARVTEVLSSIFYAEYLGSMVGAQGPAGEDGSSVTITNAEESTESGAFNTVTFSNGSVLNIRNGYDGQDGYTPVKGVDYFDGEDGYTPVKGVDYFDGLPGKDGAPGQPGKDGVDGKTPVKGVDYFDGLPGKDGKDGVDGQPGQPGRNGTGITKIRIMEVQ